MKRLLPVAMITLALAGFGCGKQEPSPVQPPVPNAEAPSNVTPQTSDVPQGISRDVLYARQVLRNLSQAKAFRASMRVPTAGGVVSTNLDYNRDFGLNGRIDVPTAEGSQTAELFSNDQEIWFRQGTSSWQDLSGTEDGKNFRLVFQNAFSYQDRYRSTISDTATLVSKSDDPSSGCTRYAFSQTTDVGTNQTFTLCVAADIPTYLTIDGPFGQIEVRYRDVNGNVEVKKPV